MFIVVRSRKVLFASMAVFLLVGHGKAGAQELLKDPELEYPEVACQQEDWKLSREEYQRKLQGFWLGECIANWTGLRTEGVRKTSPFLTDEHWGTHKGRKQQKIEFVLMKEGEVWGADDDTDIEYIYQSILDKNNVSIATAEQIREGWLTHIKTEEQNYLWVSNEKALHLMMEGMLPPQTSEPESNPLYDQIDAQLTTEIFGLFAPGRPDIALKMAHLPIRTTAYRDAEWISEFYVLMHSLASQVDPQLSQKDQVLWLADQARKRLPNQSYPAKMYDFIKREYDQNPDKNNWEETRDRLHRRHTGITTDGYNYRSWFDAGINFGASLISLFYGEGDFKRTIQIGTLCGWDSDNPTATWGGLLGFMLGRDGVEATFPEVKLSGKYQISRTRINFPDRTPDQLGDDSFEQMADRGILIIDRVVIEEMGGTVDFETNEWCIPKSSQAIPPANY
ncbi:Heme biosynthesis protein HemY [Planctomycetales bacterium 10988]|nr:Heme biosynthesis protein HemY [Planctomycetales bacterium 10988]